MGMYCLKAFDLFCHGLEFQLFQTYELSIFDPIKLAYAVLEALHLR
jgi:hypothetical protein